MLKRKKLINFKKKIIGKKTFFLNRFELSVNTGSEFIYMSDLKKLIKIIELTLDEAGFDFYTQISLSFVTETEIRNINKEYRDIDSVTDVLSFPLDMYTGILGDVVICKKRCFKQSKTFGNSFIREMMYLTCHSILHLLGYDHMNKRDKKIMRTMEKRVLKRVDF